MRRMLEVSSYAVIKLGRQFVDGYPAETLIHDDLGDLFRSVAHFLPFNSAEPGRLKFSNPPNLVTS